MNQDGSSDEEKRPEICGSFNLSYEPKAGIKAAPFGNAETNSDNDRKWSRSDKIQATVATVGTVVAVIYALQLCAMRDQVEQMKTQVEQSAEQFRLAQQPWLSVVKIFKVGEFAFDDSAGSIVVVAKTSGLTPAINAELAVDLLVIEDLQGLGSDGLGFGYTNMSRGSAGVLPPEMPITSSVPLRLGCVNGPCSTQRELRAARTFVYGYIRYRDRFDSSYCTTYCFEAEPVLGESQFPPCPTYNDVYEVDDEHPCPPPPRPGGLVPPGATKTR